MRILHLLDQYKRGGFEAHLDLMIGGLHAAGARQYVCSGPDFATSPCRREVERVEPVDFLRFDTRSLEFQVRQIARMVEEEGVELLHGQPSIALIHTALVAERTRRPFVVTFHGPPRAAELAAHFGVFYVELLRRRVLPAAAAVTVVSEWAREVLLENFPVEPDRVRVVRNPIRHEVRANSSASRVRLGLLVSRLDEDRRRSCLAALDLFAALQKEERTWRFRVLGAGTMEAELREAARERGLREVDWRGAVTDPLPHYGECTFAVGLGRVPLEAAAGGKPCVLSGYEGLAGILDSASFRSLQYHNFTARDWPALPAEVMAKLLHDALDRGVDKEVLERVRRDHESSVILAAYGSLYEQAMSEGWRQDENAEGGVSLDWLTSVPNLPLRGMDWWWSGAQLPAGLLGKPAEHAAWTEVRRQFLLQSDQLLVSVQEAVRARAEREEALGEARALREVRERDAAERTALEASLREQVVQLERRVEDLAAEARAGEKTKRELAEKVGDLESRLREWEAATRAWQERAEQSESRLRSAEQAQAELRSRMESVVREYQAEVDRNLGQLRGQRAWKLMLLARMAYTHVAREGWRGWARMLWAGVRACFGARLPLRHYDIRFPSVWEYLPNELMRGAGRTLASGQPSPGGEGPPCVLGERRRYDVVIFPVFDYEFRFQRPQQLAVQFARAGHRVYWISPGRLLGEDSPEKAQLVPMRENLWEVRLQRPVLDIYGGRLEAEAETCCSEALRALWRAAGISECCLLVQFPFWGGLAMRLREMGAGRVVYDLMDDWGHWPVEPKIGAYALEQEQRLLRSCDVLTVTAEHFRRRHEDNHPAPLLVRNGADFEFFEAAEEHPALAELARPVVGYYGAISSWFDVDLVAGLARKRPAASFVLIGQVHDVDVSALETLENVHLLGERHYRELPAYLAAFDVCLLPFRLTELTRGVDPVKLYEYLSQGKPVVASAMPELALFGDHIRTAQDEAEWETQLESALADQDEEARRLRIAFAREHSWTSRWRQMDEAVGAAFPLVSILVVTYQSAPYLAAFHEALLRNTSYPNYELIYFDNASTDGSAEILRQLSGENGRVRVLISDKNLGFAGGNNAAGRMAEGQILVLLNPDVLVTEGWLGRLVRVLERDSEVGLAAPVTNFSGNETKIDFEYHDQAQMEEFARRIAMEQEGRTWEIQMAPLLCAAISRALWEETGGLDERFAVGMFEDDDLCMRIRRAGRRIVTAEDCFIHHFGNGAFSTLPSRESEQIFERNRKAFESKWGVVWEPHQMRPGVKRLAEEPAFKVASFVGGGARAAQQRPHAPVLLRLLPPTTRVGQPVNLQADGSSALAIECDHATPGITATVNGAAIPTTFGTEQFLSAQMPLELFDRPGVHVIRLASDNGESGAVRFEVYADGSPEGAG